MKTEFAQDVTVNTLIGLSNLGVEININDGQISEVIWPEEA